MKTPILVIDDEENIRFTLESFLLGAGYEVTTASNYYEAETTLDKSNFDLIFVDILLKDNKTGIDFLREVKKRNLYSPVVMITGNPSIETALDAVRLGAYNYIQKPVFKDTLLHVTKMALRHKTIVDEKEKYRLNLEAIFRSVKDAIITVDKELVIIEMNDASRDICELTREDIGKPFNSLAKHCDGKCLDILKETIRKKESVEIYRLECHKNTCPAQVVNICAHPFLNDKGLPGGVVLVVRDETRLACLEQDMKERQQFHNIIGKSEKMQAIYSLIEDLADVQTTVLITGESGTGKELVAEAIHYKGERRNKPLVKVNCSALSESLLESELFGHVKGAFTGAMHERMGRIEKANGGTLFLDEIGDISPKVQLQLLRVLQEREFERVGDSTPVRVDVRMIAATNQDLQKKVLRGEFREDLYYRLKVVEIKLPSLCERREDIPLLIGHFLNKLNKKLNKEIIAISSDVQKIFMDYSWPGNIRELEHTLEHACILCHQNTITLEHLPIDMRDFIDTHSFTPGDLKLDEPEVIIQALEKTAWNKARAARLLGISRQTIYRKIDEYKIKTHDIDT